MKRKIDIMSIIGLILAFGLMVFGIMCSKKADGSGYEFVTTTIKSFFDLPSIIIVVVSYVYRLYILVSARVFR